jgi:hypothetical protein
VRNSNVLPTYEHWPRSKYTSTLKTVWEESRLVRVTGTSAKFVMGPKPPSDRQVAQVLGLCQFTPTTQMQIGSILENKILTAYCKHEQLQLHKTRGGHTYIEVATRVQLRWSYTHRMGEQLKRQSKVWC